MGLSAITLLCFAALQPFLGSGERDDHSRDLKQIYIKVTVTNHFANISYPTTVSKGIPMLGVLNHLQDTNKSFNFTYSINKSFGIYLESVNGLAGSTEKHTHWELLLKKDNSRTRLNVGIGCYQPQKNENFITWD